MSASIRFPHLGKNIINNMRLKKVLKESKTVLSNVNINRVFRSFIRKTQ